MVTFIRKKIKSQTLGEKLKKIRKESRITLGEIAKSKKIKKEYLEKIEADEFNQLPPMVYVKGFLRGYAEYLGIDSEKVIQQFEKEMRINSNLDKRNKKQEKKFQLDIPHLTLSPKMISFFLFLFLASAGFIYFYQELNNFSKNPRLVILQPVSDVSTKENSFEILGITDKQNEVTINDQTIYVDSEGHFKESLTLQKGLNSIKIKAKNKFNNISEEKINIFSNYEVAVAGETEQNNNIEENGQNGQKEEKKEKLILEISVKDIPVWIAVKIDDQGTQSATMLPDSIQIFEANEKILLTSGKANKTFIKINNQDMKMLNESPGVIRDAIITKDNLIIQNKTEEENNN